MKTIKVSLLSEEKNYVTKVFSDVKSILEDDHITEIELNVENSNKSTIDDLTIIVMSIIKEKLIRSYIEKEYSKIYPDDKEKIYLYSLDILKNKEYFLRESIRQKLSSYIKSNDCINLDGFINFRMKNFKKYISNITDRAVEEYIIRKDQDEFVNLLRYFIEIQDEKINIIRVHIKDKDTYLLYDENGNIINRMNNEDIMNMVIEENFDSEDFLISTLLSLCPKKIEILDTAKDSISKDVVSTIKSIFREKVVVIYEN